MENTDQKTDEKVMPMIPTVLTAPTAAEDMSYERLKALVPGKLKKNFEEIEAGRRLPELYYDRPFKSIFDADIHKDRVETLFRLIFGKEETVCSSLKNEMQKPSIYSKGTILDLLAALGSGACLDLEMQVAAQEFIPQRIEVYTSDLVMMQYTVCRQEKKDALDFSNLNHTYFVVLMKESPRLFFNNRAFLHRKRAITDTGIELPGIAHVVYIELDKCLNQWLSGNCPAELEELAVWLCAIADINNEKVKKATCSNPDFRKMRQELEIMGKDREELASMLFDKYEESVRYSGLQQAMREGREAGRQEGREEGREEGRKDGELLKLIGQIKKKVEKEKTAAEISEALEEEIEIVEVLCRLVKDNPEKENEEILKQLHKIMSP